MFIVVNLHVAQFLYYCCILDICCGNAIWLRIIVKTDIDAPCPHESPAASAARCPVVAKCGSYILLPARTEAWTDAEADSFSSSQHVPRGKRLLFVSERPFYSSEL